MSAVLIACKVLEKELLHALPDDADVEIVWLEAGLHASLPRLEEALTTAIAGAKPSERKVCLLYGQGCHPEIGSFLASQGVAAFPVKNCIEALLGNRCAGDQRHEDDDHDARMGAGVAGHHGSPGMERGRCPHQPGEV